SEGMRSHIPTRDNMTVIASSWEDAEVAPADLVICSHVLYGVADPVPFINKLERSARDHVFVMIRESDLPHPAAELRRRDAGAAFQAAEIEGVVVGLQRLRPYAPGLIWYEGLRVASEHRRQGVARAMLAAAIEEAREQGFREMRLATRDRPAVSLFESAGFERLVEMKWWRGPRVEGGEPARMPDAAEARKLWKAVESSPGIQLYAGVVPDMNGARDLNADELERLAGI